RDVLRRGWTVPAPGLSPAERTLLSADSLDGDKATAPFAEIFASPRLTSAAGVRPGAATGGRGGSVQNVCVAGTLTPQRGLKRSYAAARARGASSPRPSPIPAASPAPAVPPSVDPPAAAGSVPPGRALLI